MESIYYKTSKTKLWRLWSVKRCLESLSWDLLCTESPGVEDSSLDRDRAVSGSNRWWRMCAASVPVCPLQTAPPAPPAADTVCASGCWGTSWCGESPRKPHQCLVTASIRDPEREGPGRRFSSAPRRQPSGCDLQTEQEAEGMEPLIRQINPNIAPKWTHRNSSINSRNHDGISCDHRWQPRAKDEDSLTCRQLTFHTAADVLTGIPQSDLFWSPANSCNYPIWA